MKSSWANKRKKLYIRFFLVLTVLTSTLILLLTLILSWSFEGMIQKKIYDETLYSLNQSSQFATVVADTVARLTYQIYIDKSVSRLLFAPLPDVFEVQPLLQHLSNYSTVMPFIDSIYVYNQSVGYIFSGSSYQNQVQMIDNFIDKGFLDLVRIPDSNKILKPIPRLANVDFDTETERSFYTFYYYDWLNQKSGVHTAVAVNLSASWLNSVTTTVDLSMDASTIIVDRNCMVVSNDTTYPMGFYVSEIKSLKPALASQSSGYFTTQLHGRQMFIAFSGFNTLGWKYLKLIPYSYIRKEINGIRLNSGVIAVIILFAGLLASFFASKKLYQPVEAIRSNLQLLEDEQRRNIEKLKKAFLEDLLHNRVSSGLDDIQGTFSQLLVFLKPENTYYLALFKLDGLRDFLNSYSIEEQKNFKLEIQRTAAEFCSPHFFLETLETDNHDLCLILNSRAELRAIDDDYFTEIFSKMQVSVQKACSISFTVILSEPGDTVQSIHDLYEQTQRTSLHRIFHKKGSILFAQNIKKLDENPYHYPETKEQKLIDFIMSGSISDAKLLCLDIIRETKDYSILVLNLVVSRLSFIMDDLLGKIRKDRGIDFLPSSSLDLIELSNYESLEELNAVFLDLLDEHGILLKTKKSLKFAEIVTKIEKYVQENYSNPLLSIDRIAEALTLSTAHIERLYKLQKRKTIHDLITETRMKKAQELLLHTSINIWQVAQKTGYNSNSYFCIAFKKKHGMTPVEYRKSSV